MYISSCVIVKYVHGTTISNVTGIYMNYCVQCTRCPCSDDISSCNNSVEYPGNSDSVIVTMSNIMEYACISVHIAILRNYDRCP